MEERVGIRKYDVVPIVDMVGDTEVRGFQVAWHSQLLAILPVLGKQSCAWLADANEGWRRRIQDRSPKVIEWPRRHPSLHPRRSKRCSQQQYRYKRISERSPSKATAGATGL